MHQSHRSPLHRSPLHVDIPLPRKLEVIHVDDSPCADTESLSLRDQCDEEDRKWVGPFDCNSPSDIDALRGPSPYSNTSPFSPLPAPELFDSLSPYVSAPASASVYVSGPSRAEGESPPSPVIHASAAVLSPLAINLPPAALANTTCTLSAPSSDSRLPRSHTLPSLKTLELQDGLVRCYCYVDPTHESVSHITDHKPTNLNIANSLSTSSIPSKCASPPRLHPIASAHMPTPITLDETCHKPSRPHVEAHCVCQGNHSTARPNNQPQQQQQREGASQPPAPDCSNPNSKSDSKHKSSPSRNHCSIQ